MVNIKDMSIEPIGLGTWKMGDDSNNHQDEIDAIQFAINQGANVIDTAEMYGDGASEELIGEAIQSYDREKLYIISKVHPENASRDKVLTSIDNSLKRLRTDYIDLYLLHWKSQYPLEETISAFEEAKNLGKIKEWGVSNFDTSDMKHLLSLPNGHECVANQVRYNIGDRGIEYDLKPFMRENNIALISYAPIARGDKLGKNLTKSPVLLELSRKYEVDVFQILLAWNIRDGHTLAIPKSSNKLHIENNMGASNIHLTEEDIQKIDSEFPPPTTKEPLALY
ncbi:MULTISPECIES: aldo/keto reductase [Mammaliicoccus]|uniref:aldo/keto reductase n=1 Tax=Mammaliicoccus TaxID=2803850 RepID=UPI001C4FFA25|nr:MULTISPECIES: aldo/keto reductase [Mammaliicoccus]MBW0766642.1 aldo/keto reductase [Mammaliicoccus lentus]MDQ7141696.1 aldo/keto reductase [Mammaliicoccus lentus]WHI54433.1 aldo/keto reductase [Mammaliicoccus lentus]WHI56955.1 aldo/keto reductase [Mammaliicoccus lentus]WHI64800.1 aldo/keto reductase [Mammaliicoccus lentus]